MTSCGLAMIYIPAYLIISFHFDKKRALATGLAVSGSGFGVFILPPLAEFLIDMFGWMNTCFLLGAISSHTFISYCLFQEPHLASTIKEESENTNEIKVLSTKTENLSKKSTENSRFRQFHDILNDLKNIYSKKNFLIVNLSYFILSFAIAAPYNFLPSHIKLTKLEDPSSRSISLIGISSLIGQITIGILSDYYRSINWLIYAICVIIAGLATCILPFLTEIHLIYIYSVVFGLTTSVNYVLQSTLVIESLGLANLTLAFGCVQLIQGFSTLFGAPVLGWIKDATTDYVASFVTSGLIIILSGFVLLFWPLKNSSKNMNGHKNSNVLEFETLNVNSG
jgi:MFS family permease